MVKTIQTYVTDEHSSEFEAFLKKSYHLENFHLLRERKSQNLLIQFYDQSDHDIFVKESLDAKFLIKYYSE